MIFPEQCRIHGEFGQPGHFLIKITDYVAFYAVASNRFEWEHVSVSIKTFNMKKNQVTGELKRTPNWNEMCLIKERFWDKDEVVMQLHTVKSQYVKMNPHTIASYTLHLWKPTTKSIPLPPPVLVGKMKNKF